MKWSAALAACFVCLNIAVAQPAARDPRALAAFGPHPGDALPASLAFRDETGARIEFGDYYGSSPIVLVFAWYGCTTLCPTIVETVARTLERTGATPGLGYQVVVASIDPLDSPNAAMTMKRDHLDVLTTPEHVRAWHLLTGSERSIAALAHAAGFRYGYDANTHQYAHPTGLVLVTPQGAIARYFPGLDFNAARLRVALRDAAARRIAAPADFVQLLCFHVAAAGRYTAEILQALRFVTIGALAAALAVVFRTRRRGCAAKRG